MRLPHQTLTFGVFGNPDEIASYQQMVTLFAPLSRQVRVKVESWPDHTAMLDAVRNGERVPDVFLASHRDLLWLQQHQVLQPVDALLDDRGVSFGDDYPRDSLTAFGSDSHLLCLPYGIDPTVIFYNKALVRFRQMRVDPPTAGEGWSLQQFANTARWAVRHHPGVSGMYVDPSLEGISPFVYSGGGQVFGDGVTPTSLALSSPNSQAALNQALAVLDRGGLTLSAKRQLSKTPLEWFENGKLAMIEGNRDLVPVLRQVLGFEFDVMPMPTLETPGTVGGLTGLCVSRTARDPNTAADFVVYASSPDALGEVADAGYLQPANQAVALTDAFQQPGRLPVHSSVFTFAVKSMAIPPMIDHWDQLGQHVDPLIAKLAGIPQFELPFVLPSQTSRIDRISRRILAPVLVPGPNPASSSQSP